MARRLPKPEQKRMLEAAARLMNESVGMRKIGKLWSSESAWDAVHAEPARVLPRYRVSARGARHNMRQALNLSLR